LLDEVESELEAEELVPEDETEVGTTTVAEDEADLDEEDTTEEEDGEAPEKEALDLAGVLPAALGGADSLDEDLERLPDEMAELEEASSSFWQQVRELWLLILMAFLGVLIGLVVYLSFRDGFEWPWSSDVGLGQPASTELLAEDLEEAPERREIIAAFDFEDPAQAGAQNKPPPQPTSGAVLTGVDRITWEESQNQTVLTLWGDGPFDTDQLVVFRLDTDTPRQVVKILGVSRPFSRRNLAVGTSHVSAIRTGLHTGDAGQELHVVADLEDPAVRMRRMEPEGSQLHVYFSKL
jgi:hypothetical protein